VGDDGPKVNTPMGGVEDEGEAVGEGDARLERWEGSEVGKDSDSGWDSGLGLGLGSKERTRVACGLGTGLERGAGACLVAEGPKVNTPKGGVPTASGSVRLVDSVDSDSDSDSKGLKDSKDSDSDLESKVGARIV
jgi:hypothetical protein